MFFGFTVFHKLVGWYANQQTLTPTFRGVSSMASRRLEHRDGLEPLLAHMK